VKPANVQVEGDDTAKVLDIGVAKALEAVPNSDPRPTLTAASGWRFTASAPAGVPHGRRRVPGEQRRGQALANLVC